MFHATAFTEEKQLQYSCTAHQNQCALVEFIDAFL